MGYLSEIRATDSCPHPSRMPPSFCSGILKRTPVQNFARRLQEDLGLHKRLTATSLDDSSLLSNLHHITPADSCYQNFRSQSYIILTQIHLTYVLLLSYLSSTCSNLPQITSHCPHFKFIYHKIL